MKIRIHYLTAMLCLFSIVVLAQKSELEGTWVTEGLATVEAAKKAGKSLNGLPEGTSIKFKVDVKKNKLSGKITQLNSGKEYDIEDGKVADKAFTFKSIEVVSSSFGNSGNFGNNNRGGNVPFGSSSQPPALSWKGELTEPDMITLTRLSDTGEPAGASLVLHRAKK